MKDQNLIIKKLNFLIKLLKDRHDKHYRDSHFHLWADLLLAGTLVGLVIILIWLLVWQPKADFIFKPNIEASRVISGQIQDFSIYYENEEDNSISLVNLKLDLPENMEVVSTSGLFQFDPTSNTFTIDELKDKAKGEIYFKALVRGAINERQSLAFMLTYQDGNIRKQLLDSVVYHIDASVLELSLDVPEKIYSEVPFNGTVKIKNAGDAKLSKVAVSFLPEDWEIKPDQGDLEEGRIVTADFAAGEERSLSFSAMPKINGENQPFIAKSFLIIDNKAIEQSSVEKRLNVIEPSLKIVSNFEQSSFSESPVDLNVVIKNNDTNEISDISLAIESQRENMSVVGVSTSVSGAASANNIISLEKNLSSGNERTIPLKIDLKRRGNSLNDFVSLGIKVSYKMNGEDFSYVVAAPKLKIDSNLNVSSQGYYYGPQGDQLGIGPIPPQVDIPTTYWIIWEANNLGNDVANFEVKADLPSNVVWLEQQSLVAGEISYSPVTRRIVWKLASLPQNGGNFRASFAVSIVPREEDIGKTPNLLTNISFSGEDQYSQAHILKNLANITTNIEKDSRAGGKGAVVPLE